MRVIITPEVDMLRAHERARGSQPQQKAPAAIGTLEAARLLDKREFMFRGRPYKVPPVPWPLAAELLDVMQEQGRIDALGVGAPKSEVVEVFARASRLSKLACHPAGFIRRLLWPITPNPFRNATPWQVGRNLGFFWLSHILDGDMPGMAVRPLQPGTSSPTSQGSSSTSRRGPARTGSRSRGVTS